MDHAHPIEQSLNARLLRHRSRREREDVAALARDLMQAQRYGDARGVLVDAQPPEAPDPRLLLLEGRAWYEDGAPSRALEIFLALSEAAPEAPDPYYWMGRCLLDADDPLRAASALRRCLALAPEYDKAKLLLHRALTRIDRVDEQVRLREARAALASPRVELAAPHVPTSPGLGIHALGAVLTPSLATGASSAGDIDAPDMASSAGALDAPIEPPRSCDEQPSDERPLDAQPLDAQPFNDAPCGAFSSAMAPASAAGAHEPVRGAFSARTVHALVSPVAVSQAPAPASADVALGAPQDADVPGVSVVGVQHEAASSHASDLSPASALAPDLSPVAPDAPSSPVAAPEAAPASSPTALEAAPASSLAAPEAAPASLPSQGLAGRRSLAWLATGVTALGCAVTGYLLAAHVGLPWFRDGSPPNLAAAGPAVGLVVAPGAEGASDPRGVPRGLAAAPERAQPMQQAQPQHVQPITAVSAVTDAAPEVPAVTVATAGEATPPPSTSLAPAGAVAEGTARPAPPPTVDDLDEAARLLELGRAVEARAAFERVSGPLADSHEGRLVAARLALAEGHPAVALGAVEPIRALAEPSVEQLVTVGDVLHALDRVGPAAGAYQRALVLDPDAPAGLVGRAEIHLRAERPDDALRLLQRSATLVTDRQPVLQARLQTALGRAYLQRARGGDRMLAEQALRRALTLGSPPAEAYFWLGESQAARRTPEAAPAYIRYLELAPTGRYSGRARKALGPLLSN